MQKFLKFLNHCWGFTAQPTCPYAGISAIAVIREDNDSYEHKNDEQYVVKELDLSVQTINYYPFATLYREYQITKKIDYLSMQLSIIHPITQDRVEEASLTMKYLPGVDLFNIAKGLRADPDETLRTEIAEHLLCELKIKSPILFIGI